MSFEQLVFYAFSAFAIFGGLMVITAKHPVHAALFLVLTFFSTAGLWMMLEAEFLAITLVLVYVGAVMVLFLFVVMMLDLDLKKLRSGFAKYLPIGVIVAVAMMVQMAMVLGPENLGLQQFGEATRHAADYSNTEELGYLLYTVYLYPFEIAAVILLVAIVAAIALTMRKRPGNKYQDPATQVQVKRDDRVKLVDVPSGEKGGKA